MMVKPQNRIFGLDLLRCFAILLVLVSHTLPLSSRNPGLETVYYNLGVIGVELFFVLSGFLIGSILIRMYNDTSVINIRTVSSFWVRRWFRTLPNYYLVIIFYNIIYFASYRGLVFSLHSNTSYFFFFQNFISQMPDKIFTVSWSLGIEEWFYLLFPLFLFTIQFFIKRKPTGFLLVISIFIFLPLLLRIIVALNNTGISWDNGYRKIIPLRLDAIAYGVLMSYAWYYYTDFIKKQQLVLFISGVLLLSAVICYQHFYYYNFISKTLLLSFFSIASVLLIPGLISVNKPNKHILSIVTFISIISYSIYLLHMLVLLLVQIVEHKFNISPPVYVTIIIIWLVTFFVSYLQYYFFESRVTRIRDHLNFGYFKKQKKVL